MKEERNYISLGYKFNTHTFEDLLVNLPQKMQDQYLIGDKITFDMSKLTDISLGGLVSFLSLCGAIKEGKLLKEAKFQPISLHLPPPGVIHYLHRMQFFKIANIANIYGLIDNSESLSQEDEKLFKEWENRVSECSKESDPEKKRQYKLTNFPIHFLPPRSRFTDFESECQDFANKLSDVVGYVLEEDLNFSKELRRGFIRSNIELFKNIYDHSQSWGVVAIQVLKNEVVFSYSDIGMGIKNSLRETLNINDNIDDCLAIEKAIQKGVSSKGENNNRGLGLYYVTKYIEETKGRMLIRSGKGLYSINRKKKGKYFPGTQIHIALPKQKTNKEG